MTRTPMAALPAGTPTGTRRGGAGVLRGTALYTAAVVGPGILTLPGLAAQAAGPASLLVLAVLLVASVPIAHTFVAIERTGATGGIVGYVSTAFGPVAGRIAGAWFRYGVPVGIPALGLIGGAYVAQAVGGGRTTTLLVATAITATAVVAAIGRRAGTGALVPVLTGLVVALVVVTAALAAPHASTTALTPLAPDGWAGVLQAALVLTWVLTGWEAAAAFPRTLRDPARTLPRVTALTLVVVAVLYGLVAVPQLLVLGPRAGGTDAPVAAMLDLAVGNLGVAVAAVVAAAVATGNATAYAGSLVETGAAQSGDDPARPAVRARALTVPVLIMVAALTAAATTPVDVAFLVALTAGSQVPVYVLGLAAGLRLLTRGTRAWWTALLATSAVATLLVPAGPYLAAPAAIGVAVLAAALVRRLRPAHHRTTPTRQEPR
ncbi:amino acid permease [Promicromonospora sukumoe]|uniref:amino acid permease n=1 Tax=Promicromonospora sukumoe TaxID=88382 RepID=UPI003659B5FE